MQVIITLIKRENKNLTWLKQFSKYIKYKSDRYVSYNNIKLKIKVSLALNYVIISNDEFNIIFTIGSNLLVSINKFPRQAFP